MKVQRRDLSIYIDSTEVLYIAFPSFNGSVCDYSTIDISQRDRLDKAFINAQQIVDRFVADGRENASSIEIKKAFNRNW